ncbi:GTP cyclohydrolase I [Candidatus Ruthia magnifica str. Cm (Calyptogena magnifica)]|uniref:NADPH-dependent 7-cyano-7-deazaguanine reductase n=1 Tax=Ruthia magnifica subsp. Calyptogena magnifica TaxID=413404 RepID=QUEF_RUTMC|nr:preQ(1) synthase [Candidatus Ruthturnera calyptogenae]A1AWC8.1 RecName: Full=NADPH-dependent 7-cyano-7-deazaguanine reductase; AltName: Full=7-cyano-7-carbaguanine reductase; AltName: Full=NADPH-dependent nitrile oxidoreductase; AltName: Full=PreQ(0) reductase [Candidatus Ruthia magnifica str. Cm (Calyptogena magnifica)]ABL02235.1 GTP cyclohydrolase I [Candidatus Ruthia magnifica str. Cm (Calyptogena magnifica)]
MSYQPNKVLEVFDNPKIERDFIIQINMPEFTCLCPKTGQPDFATLHFAYIADKACIELKSLKMYIWLYRNEGAFHEAVTNQILDDLVQVSNPRFIRLKAIFNIRGGVYTTIITEHKQKNWTPKAKVDL